MSDTEGITDTAATGTNKFQDLVDQLEQAQLEELLPDYSDPLSTITAVLDVRGLQATAAFPVPGSTLLTLNVPCSGTSETFEGATRDDSVEQLRDFFESSGSAQRSILQCLVSDSPVDPVAGNPNSLMATMAASDFRVGSRTDAGETNLFGLSAEASYAEADNFVTKSISLPLNYVLTIPNPTKPPYAFIVDMPVRYLDIEGASVWDGSIGVGFRVPIFTRWAVTPMLRAGFVGSTEAGSVQSVYSGSVTSKLDFYLSDLRLSANNMIGYSQTGEITGGDFSQNYDIQNVIFRNGLAVEGSLDFTLFEDPTSWELQYIDTRITGDDWFYNWYDEIVLSVGTRQRATRMKWQDLRLGGRYTFSDDFNRFELVLNYRF